MKRYDVAIVHPNVVNGFGDPAMPDRHWVGATRLEAEVILRWARWRHGHWPAYRGSHWAIIPSRGRA